MPDHEDFARRLIAAVGQCIQHEKDGYDVLASSYWDDVRRIWQEREQAMESATSVSIEVAMINTDGWLAVCLCDLDDADLAYDSKLGQYQICNAHKAAKLASLTERGLQCAVWLGRIDDKGDFQREPIKQLQ